jgi:hypothetical protein
MSFTKRLYNSIYDFFDNKIIPGNSPVVGASGGNTYPWSGKVWGLNPPSSSNTLLPDFSLRKLYNSNPGININIDPTPWYKDWMPSATTILWIGGSLALAGITYFGYKFLTDPTFIVSMFSPTVLPSGGTGNMGPASPPTDGSITPTNISNTTTSIVGTATTSLVKGITNNIKKLNPLYWLPANEPSVEQRMFNINQVSQNYDNRYYPFTEVHPYDSWYERLRVSILGESSYERAVRLSMKDQIINNFFVPTIKASAQVTPHITSVGLDQSVWNRFHSLPSTPISILSPLPNIAPTNLPLENVPGSGQWETHVKASNDGIEDFYKNWKDRNSGNWVKPKSFAQVASSSKIKVEDINKFTNLGID